MKVGDVISVSELNGRIVNFTGVVVEEKGEGFLVYIKEDEREGIIEHWVSTVFVLEGDIKYNKVKDSEN